MSNEGRVVAVSSGRISVGFIGYGAADAIRAALDAA